MIDWNQIDIVLLDMDGTLLDLHYDNTVWNGLLPVHYAQHHGLSTDDANAHLMAHMRMVYGTIEFYCLDHWQDFAGFDVLDPHRDAVHLIQWRANAREFLKKTRARGIPLILATNAHRKSIAIKDEYSNLVEMLDDVASAHDYGIPKEDQGYWQALQQAYDFAPARALFVDDNASVLNAARDFGIGQVLAVAQPDSARPPRDDFDYPVLQDFEQIYPPDV